MTKRFNRAFKPLAPLAGDLEVRKSGVGPQADAVLPWNLEPNKKGILVFDGADNNPTCRERVSLAS